MRTAISKNGRNISAGKSHSLHNLSGETMNFTTAVRTCLKKYFVFSGRATRSEFWWFYLFTVLLGFVGGIIDGILDASGAVSLVGDLGIFGGLASLFTIIPSLTASTRRLHDTGRTGWWLGRTNDNDRSSWRNPRCIRKPASFINGDGIRYCGADRLRLGISTFCFLLPGQRTGNQSLWPE